MIWTVDKNNIVSIALYFELHFYLLKFSKKKNKTVSKELIPSICQYLVLGVIELCFSD